MKDSMSNTEVNINEEKIENENAAVTNKESEHLEQQNVPESINQEFDLTSNLEDISGEENNVENELNDTTNGEKITETLINTENTAKSTVNSVKIDEKLAIESIQNPQNVIEGVKPEGKAKRKRKRPLIRSRVRKRMLLEQQLKEAVLSTGPPGAEEIEYCLTVTNLPNNWSFMDIKNYIDTQCGPVDEIELIKDEKTDKGAIRLSYQTEQECKEAMSKLTDKEIDGTKLALEMSVVSLEDEMPETPPEPPSTVMPVEEVKLIQPWRPDLDVWEIDPEGLYGLKPSFLQKLNITPPLDKWVRVSNFRCDKSELREILDLAGTVLMFSVFNVSYKYANVMYSHPLEAVQAVSMLNSQSYYGQTLKVVMDRSPVDTILLPKGLSNIGPGLGAYGKPLRNIAKHYKRYVTNRSASINHKAFEMIGTVENNDVSKPVKYTVKSVEDFKCVINSSKSTVISTSTTTVITTVNKAKPTMTPSKPTVTPSTPQSKPNPVSKVTPSPVRSPNPRPNFTQNMPRNNFSPRPFGPNPGWNGPGPMRPGMPGPMNRPMGPVARPMGPRPSLMGPMPGPMQGPMRGPGPGPMPGPMQGPMPRPMQGPMPGPMQGPMPRPMQGPMPGPMQGPMPGPMQGPIQGPMQGPIQSPMQTPMPGPMLGQMPGPMQGQMGAMQPSGQVGSWSTGNEPVQLQLSNMPPTTTFNLLCGKMAECGQVVSIQLTTPGCAVVTFANRMQADRCFQTYNGKLIEGYVMQVRYS